jgi:large subunit ribosomal protein L20
MARVSSSVAAKRRKKRVLEAAKGFRAERGKRFRRAKETLDRALRYAYRDRKARKRAFRALWISRINAATREKGMLYKDFIAGLKKKNILLSRDILADLAVREPEVFAKIVEAAKN